VTGPEDAGEGDEGESDLASDKPSGLSRWEDEGTGIASPATTTRDDIKVSLLSRVI
jgi:hypothetical protein